MMQPYGPAQVSLVTCSYAYLTASVPPQQNSLVFLGRRSRTKSDLSLKMYQEEIQVETDTLGGALLVGGLGRFYVLCDSGPKPFAASIF